MASAQVARPLPQALPVWNQSSGKVEAVLLLEPVSTASWQFGNTRLDSALGVGAGDTLGLLCDRRARFGGAIGSLVDNCLVASLGDGRGNRQASAGATVSRKGGRLGVGVGNSREAMPAWLAPGKANSRVNQNALTLIGEKNIGREATVSIAGTLARARLVAPSAVPELADRWDIKTLSVGTNVGRFGANVIGRVVDSPSQPGHWEGLDLGLSWRTPWSGQLSVGAENVVTRGRNPFAPGSGEKDEGAVPYVRYQQDL
ncbi:XOO1806 family protein [Lysobacter xanthus]